MDVFAQEDAVENFLAGDGKDEFNNELLLSHVDDENDDIEFKRENILECGNLEENVANCELNGNAETEASKEEKNVTVDFKRYRRNSLANALKKRSIRW